MTEKRFNILKNELDFYFDVSDTEKRWEIGDVELDNLPVFEDLVDLLNEIAEENEQLKSDLDYFQRTYEIEERGLDIVAPMCTIGSPTPSRLQLFNENEQLKKREETLLCEIEDFQELLTKNDGVCHKRVIDLIDDRISNFSNVKAELLLHSDDDYRLEKLSFAIQNLRELKKELSEGIV